MLAFIRRVGLIRVLNGIINLAGLVTLALGFLVGILSGKHSQSQMPNFTPQIVT